MTPPEEKYKVVPYDQIYLDLGVHGAEAVRALGIEHRFAGHLPAGVPAASRHPDHRHGD